jgi:hypothetical protein
MEPPDRTFRQASIAVVGVLFAPGLRLLWAVLLFFDVARFHQRLGATADASSQTGAGSASES